jgi:hypothetical protein
MRSRHPRSPRTRDQRDASGPQASNSGNGTRAKSIRAGIRRSSKQTLRYLCRLAKDMGDVVRGKL